jgi:two-component system nitrate/nitrite response regulator NarL
MNFLVSGNYEAIGQFQSALKERGKLMLLPSFQDLLNHAELSGAAIAIIDNTSPGFDAEPGLKQLKNANAALKILLVGVAQSPEQELAALAAGAMGCCDPALKADQVRRILSIVEDGSVWISNAALPHLLEQLRRRSQAVSQTPPPTAEEVAKNLAAMAGLTQREREISQMVAEGLSNKVIARKLDITDRTVKAHLTTVFQKLHVNDRLQLALYVTKGVHG